MIKKGLKVKVLAGKDKKKEGEVIEIDRANDRAKVKEINMVKKHVKTTKEKKGGIFSKESFIHISNLKVVDNNKTINIDSMQTGNDIIKEFNTEDSRLRLVHRLDKETSGIMMLAAIVQSSRYFSNRYHSYSFRL